MTQSAVHLLLVILIFGVIFVLAENHLKGELRTIVKFLSGVVIVVVLLKFIFHLFGIHF